jgi:hypothetical protein
MLTRNTMPTITAADNNELEIELGVEEIKFIDALKELPDPRDNRGKRHLLAFLIVTVVFAILVGRSNVSGIHRYMTNKIEWLRETTGFKAATPISRAHLPRMLASLDWPMLSRSYALTNYFIFKSISYIETMLATAINNLLIL